MSEPDQTKVNSPEETAGEFTLEQILSEYKSEAFMRDEKKLSKKALEEQADRILAEVREELDRDAAGEALSALAEETDREAAPTEPAPAAETAAPAPSPKEAPKPAPEPEREETQEEKILRFAERAAKAAALAEEKAAREAEQHRLREEEAKAREEQRQRREEERLEARTRRAEEKAELRRRREEEKSAREEARKKARQEWLLKTADLSPSEAAEKYASGIRSLHRRTVLAFLLCGAMALVTLLGGGEKTELAFLHGRAAICTALLVLQLLTMLCGWDILAKGIGALVSAKPGCETLVTFANLAALGDALWIIRGTEAPVGLPYCASASLVLAFALLGARMGKTALRDSFRAMRGAKVPTVVLLDPEETDLGQVITKHLGGYRGFIARMLQQDPVEDLYRKLSLLLIVISVFLALLTSLLTGEGAWLHALAGLSIAAASCTAMLAFRRPFGLSAKRLAGRGAAIAGWSGAEEVTKGKGIVLRDGDLFPEKTVSVSGMKVLSGTKVEQVISYTGSMILTSGSGLGSSFSELMRQYAAPTRRTENFQYDAEGGFSADIAQDRVLVGTGAFMNLKGIRIPANIDVTGAIYTAVNEKLCALFILEHTPSDAVRSALCTLLGGKLKPVFAIRDLNITPAMLASKFRLSGIDLSFPPAEDRFRLSADGDPEELPPPAAIMTREGLSHYVEVVRAGRRLIRAVRRSTAMTLIGTFVSMLILALGIARSAYASISAWNLLVFLLGWTAATLLISDNADGS